MVNTGFYFYATRKAGERKAEKNQDYQRKIDRLKELNINVDTK